ncbi:MAG: hypothetical protein O3C29_12195 [Proteobacteria bacterium]|nr:hypothetical protein [Pseudomonadota bacterium]MDA1291943.1 hypothetical protein [Pseudomonadota bacterium]
MTTFLNIGSLVNKWRNIAEIWIRLDFLAIYLYGGSIINMARIRHIHAAAD